MADSANPGVPIKVGMALTARETVTMFMRYVHTEDDPIRAAAEIVAARRLGVVNGETVSDKASAPAAAVGPSPPVRKARPATKTVFGTYHPCRGRKNEI